MNLLGLVNTQRNFVESGLTIFDFERMPVLDPNFAVSRSSSKTYIDDRGVMRTLAPNVGAIVDDPEFGRVLEIEPQSLNMLTQADRPDLWTCTRGSMSGGIVTLAGMSMSRFVPDTSTASHYVERDFPSSAEGTPLSLRFACKSAGLSRMRVDVLANGGTPESSFTFDLRTGEIISVSNRGNFKIRSKALADGCWLVKIEAGVYGAGSTLPRLRLLAVDNSSATGNVSLPGDGVSGFLLGAGQAESRRSCTSYIPTLAAAVTRTAESAKLAGQSLLNAANIASGTILFDAFMAQETTSGLVGVEYQINPGTSDRVGFRPAAADGNMYGQINIDGASVAANQSPRVWPASSRGWFGLGYDAAGTWLVAAGSRVTSSTVRLVAGKTPQELRLSVPGLGTHIKMKSIRFYNRRIADTELERITAL